MLLLSTMHLTKAYKQHVVVNDINLKIKTGSMTAVLGPNGAGKSTLIKLLIGQLTPSAGTVEMTHTRQPGVVFQSSVLDDALTVEENLRLRAQQYRHVPEQRVAELRVQLGLTSFFHQRYGTLSGGQKRRVDIARALLNHPEILFLDEPTTGLDIQTRTAIWQLLQDLQQRERLTIVLTTHYLNEADTADNIYILVKGCICANGTAAEIKRRYARSQLVLTVEPDAQSAVLTILAQTEFHVAGNQVICLPTDMASALRILTMCQSNLLDFEYRPGSLD
ncbi:hypothetical protein N692_06860 [Lactiplantibacillus plantarum EGD-AQ4]|nr:hypothetical protein N692_06860 [Lactiplantibacillus plantarum EGD-AQ4]